MLNKKMNLLKLNNNSLLNKIKNQLASISHLNKKRKDYQEVKDCQIKKKEVYKYLEALLQNLKYKI